MLKENKGATVLYSFNALSFESRGKLYPAEYEKWVTRESISRVESDKEKSIREEKAEDKRKKLKAEQEKQEIEEKLSRISTVLDETRIVQIIDQKTLLARPLYKYTESEPERPLFKEAGLKGLRRYDTNGRNELNDSTYNNIVCITGINTEGLVDKSLFYNDTTSCLFRGYEVGTYTYTSAMGVKKTVKKITANKKEAIEFLEKK